MDLRLHPCSVAPAECHEKCGPNRPTAESSCNNASHYVRVGVEELDQEKLTPLLRLKYHNSIADALADLGRAKEIGQVFAGFQKYLYQQQTAA